jgi:hypothetical protein
VSDSDNDTESIATTILYQAADIDDYVIEDEDKGRNKVHHLNPHAIEWKEPMNISMFPLFIKCPFIEFFAEFVRANPIFGGHILLFPPKLLFARNGLLYLAMKHTPRTHFNFPGRMFGYSVLLRVKKQALRLFFLVCFETYQFEEDYDYPLCIYKMIFKIKSPIHWIERLLIHDYCKLNGMAPII